MRQQIAYRFLFYFLLFSLPVNSQNSIKGDVNNDGIVNVADIVEIVDMIMSTDLNRKFNYSLELISDSCVYSNNTHAAFTSLIEYNGSIYLAFREGPNHVPTTVSEYGKIRVLKKKGSDWNIEYTFEDSDKDLRDPFFIVMDGRLRMYCGYNQFVGDDNTYQHSGTAYIDFLGERWDEFKMVKHDAPHIVWIWKVREYQGVYYGVGYLEGYKPILFSSVDGEEWKTVSELDVEGIVSEADLNFIGDSLYICLRKDTPTGSPSYWGKSVYPFKSFEWKVMERSIACPVFFCHPETKQMWIAGREYEKGESGERIVSVSLYEVSSNGNLYNGTRINGHGDWDKGYPSFLYNRGKLFLSYYTGIDDDSFVINISTFSLIRY